ncbi:BREX-1 system adenine-specific DNA-methyltransferase PglX [Marininema halotolerans]|uniref:site-specific DNA-methyltransferase (adenine-specific) n=1 Tax=Marininema halotolerans TaxID=1155944 RepID=A0A1I6R3K9_9BACL|nr:BREX-1 system adenine-specific DNA-methyltransferase PglX [Marininema halotolerans]SFS59341.1 N-6 DNA Methylase [Marininema halotolerans]
MDKKRLMAFAIKAREDLMKQIKVKAKSYGITENGLPDIREGQDYFELNHLRYSNNERLAFNRLFAAYQEQGLEQLMDEVAYTWFNRLIAIRYMEIHHYLPSRIRVLSTTTPGKVDPDLLTDYHHAKLPIANERIHRLLERSDREGAYRALLIAQCNQLSDSLPFLFEPIADYAALLLPDQLLHTDSVIKDLIQLDESNFAEVEVIGWLYQYYNTTKKEEIGGLRSGAVKKEDLPIVTQLYTPQWIVEYMVQNSLGKIYDRLYPANMLTKGWEYYLPSEEKDPIPNINCLEDIKVFDPACGSGHILVYAFKLLCEMYDEAGYSKREIPHLILQHNLYGCDIDKRAYQLANLALYMTAQQFYPRFLRRNQMLTTHVREIVDSDRVSAEALNLIVKNEQEKDELGAVLKQFSNGKQFGSLLEPDQQIPYEVYCERVETLAGEENFLIDRQAYIAELKTDLLPILKLGKLLSDQYEVVVTNPPYHNKYNPELKSFMVKHYKMYKADLYSAFIFRCTQWTVKNGYAALMTPFTWMFISTHQALREAIITNQSISSLIQLEYSSFKDATVPICTFVVQNQDEKPVGEYIRLSEFKGDQAEKVREAVLESVSYRYQYDSKDFKDIPGSPIAYWASEQVRKIFREQKSLGEFAEPKVGLTSGDNNRFLRMWYEIYFKPIGFNNATSEEALKSRKKWFPYNKGGSFRKWFGNQDYVINWKDDGKEIRESGRAVVRNPSYYFKEGITWSFVSSANFGVRFAPIGSVFDVGGSSLFEKKDEIKVILSFLASKLSFHFLAHINPTLNFQVGNIAILPIADMRKKRAEIESFADQNIALSKNDWDSFETSWNFEQHPFLTYRDGAQNLADSYANWSTHAEAQFQQLKANEEALNRIFIQLYGLEEELTPEVRDEEVTVRRADRLRDVKSFLSYCVGLMMGRYSLDQGGLAYAGGEWQSDHYQTFHPDNDGIIPLTEVAYFEDDIITRLSHILQVLYGEQEVANHLKWLADSLGGVRKNESPGDRLRRYFFEEFFKDHCQIYKKRPIYWLANSGRKKGIRALIYLHRYTPNTLGTLRFSYVQEMQMKLANERKYIEDQLADESLTPREKRELTKRETLLFSQQDELVQYDQTLAEVVSHQVHLDLDDGVSHNYERLGAVLAPIR